MTTIRTLAPAVLATSLLGLSTAATAGFVVTYEAPGVTETTASFQPRPDSSGKAIVGVERFDALTTGVHDAYVSDFGNGGLDITGIYSKLNVIAADQFGGASGNDRYAVAGIDLTDSYSIVFDTELTYFGYWLSALDGGNKVSFYSGDTWLYSFTPTDVLALVSGNSSYFGNPTAGFGGANKSEPYVFLNFFADVETSFDKIVFEQTVRSAGYESDNHTVGIWKELSGTVVPPSSVPEPGTLLLIGAALAAAGAVRRR